MDGDGQAAGPTGSWSWRRVRAAVPTQRRAIRSSSPDRGVVHALSHQRAWRGAGLSRDRCPELSRPTAAITGPEDQPWSRTTARASKATATSGERTRGEQAPGTAPGAARVRPAAATKRIPRRADAEGVRLPPVVERQVPDLDGQLAGVGVRQARGREQPRQVPRPYPRQPGLVPDAGGDVAGGRPERVERAAPAGLVPDACRDDGRRAGRREPSRPRPPTGSVMKWTTSCASTASKVPSSNGSSSAGACRTSTSGNRSAAAAAKDGEGSTAATRASPSRSDEHGGERAGTAAHVERGRRAATPAKSANRGRELLGVAAHEAAVGVGGDLEHDDHASPLPVGPCGPGEGGGRSAGLGIGCRPVSGSRNSRPSWRQLKSNIPVSGPARASNEPSPMRPSCQLSSMNRMTDVWSVSVWST